MKRYVIGLGSNLGDRLGFLVRARDHLSRIATLRASSSVFATKAMGPPQPDYFNAAVTIESAADPRTLLQETLSIEAALDRVRSERWGPRTIDLDILLGESANAEQIHWRDEVLSVPHAGLFFRSFALAPTLEIISELKCAAKLEPALRQALNELGGAPLLAPEQW